MITSNSAGRHLGAWNTFPKTSYFQAVEDRHFHTGFSNPILVRAGLARLSGRSIAVFRR